MCKYHWSYSTFCYWMSKRLSFKNYNLARCLVLWKKMLDKKRKTNWGVKKVVLVQSLYLFLPFLYSCFSYYSFCFVTCRSAKKYAYENLITREMQFEKPLDEDEETDEELPEDSNPIMDIMEKNLSSSNNGGRHIKE